MKPTLKYVLIGAAALAVIAGTAVGSSLITRDSMEPAQPTWCSRRSMAATSL